MVFTYKLELEDGTPADPPGFRSSAGNSWNVGDPLYLGRRTLRVVGIRQEAPRGPRIRVRRRARGRRCRALPRLPAAPAVRRPDGPAAGGMARARTRRRRPLGRSRSRPPRLYGRADQALRQADPLAQKRPAAYEGGHGPRRTPAAARHAPAASRATRRPPQPSRMAGRRVDSGGPPRGAPASPPLSAASHLRDVRDRRRRFAVRARALHGDERRSDRPDLRPPAPRLARPRPTGARRLRDSTACGDGDAKVKPQVARINMGWNGCLGQRPLV